MKDSLKGQGWQQRRSTGRALVVLVTLSLCCFIAISFIYPDVSSFSHFRRSKGGLSKKERKAILSRCRSLSQIPRGFDAAARTESDRFVAGANATLLRDAKVRSIQFCFGSSLCDFFFFVFPKIWTGSDNGREGKLIQVLP